jgi:hypothetical protein
MEESPTPGPIMRRARCRDVDAQRTRDGAWRVTVALEWTEGQIFTGTAVDHDIPEARVRAGARAAIEALAPIGADRLQFSLRGTKGVRAFDSVIVIAAVQATSAERSYRLIGSAAAPDEDLIRGGVLAVLNAVNRVLEPESPDAPIDRAE